MLRRSLSITLRIAHSIPGTTTSATTMYCSGGSSTLLPNSSHEILAVSRIQFPMSSADRPCVNEYWYLVGTDLKNLLKGISFLDLVGGTITRVGAVDRPSFWNTLRLF